MTKKCGFVALTGRPNAGKSTLINNLIGEKVSIVSDKVQTTRNRILGVYHAEDVQIGFLDLPGIHKPKHLMNRRMMSAVHQGIDDADLILHIIDVSVPIGAGDRFVHELLKEKDIPLLIVANKVDLINKNKLIPRLQEIQDLFSPLDLIPVSAKAGDNTETLIKVLSAHLPESEFLFSDETLTDQSMRSIAQELIREKLLHYTRQELPHAIAVTIEEYVFEEEEDFYFISALIWVETPSQRKIILGSGGKMISKIRTAAKRSLKQFLEKPVELEFQVKVSPKWRDQSDFLDEELGL